MALNARQRAAYKHTCAIVRVTRSINAATGVASAETYAAGLVVPCLFQPTPNLSDPVQGVGQMKRPSVFTEDSVHMESSTPIGDQDYVKDISLLPDGSRSPNYGTYYRVQGAPRIIPSAGRRQANKLSCMIMVIEHPPAGVTAVY